MIFNIAYIAHELGLFPHKRRGRSTKILQISKHLGRSINFEESQKNEKSFTPHPFTMTLRRFGHKDVYSYTDNEAQLKLVLNRFKKEPTSSHKDDLVNLMNVISSEKQVSDPTINLIEKCIKEIVFYEKKLKQEPI